MVVIAMADNAEMIWLGLAYESRGPLRKKMSSIARIKMLKILLPKRLPMARSMLLLRNLMRLNPCLEDTAYTASTRILDSNYGTSQESSNSQ